VALATGHSDATKHESAGSMVCLLLLDTLTLRNMNLLLAQSPFYIYKWVKNLCLLLFLL
jgi:hypothetical protein